ncbi:hypothetical protein PIB30_071501 [Stylosanthes scabra]|uniref:Uncharacterized protein n=1 Tax=Stylosanthes scabra TaxID=79078 RepID=A0ABU6UMK0_9FABA|nr:hypothetical protein [Stylosanthes scabra]
MSRVKQAGKRARTDPNAPQSPLRLSQTPVEWWFAEDDDRTAFDERLSRMEILPPKYIGDGVLPDAKYPKFWRLIDIQGLRPFLYTRWRYYPHFVAAAFTTIFIREDEDEGEEFALDFRLGGREYKFTLAALATAWGLMDKGDTFKGGNYLLGTWNEFSKATAVRELHLEYATPGKYAVSRMSTDHRLLLYVLSYVLLPRKSNHGTATEEDLLILWAIVNEKQIHWPYLMAHRMLHYSQGKATSFLGIAHLWTRLFEMAPLDLSREEVVNPVHLHPYYICWAHYHSSLTFLFLNPHPTSTSASLHHQEKMSDKRMMRSEKVESTLSSYKSNKAFKGAWPRRKSRPCGHTVNEEGSLRFALMRAKG